MIEPLGDIVVIEVIPPAKETASGIILTEDWKTLPPKGKVIAIGDGVKNEGLIGKVVVFERYTSVVLEDNLRLCRESNILAVDHGSARE